MIIFNFGEDAAAKCFNYNILLYKIIIYIENKIQKKTLKINFTNLIDNNKILKFFFFFQFNIKLMKEDLTFIV